MVSKVEKQRVKRRAKYEREKQLLTRRQLREKYLLQKRLTAKKTENECTENTCTAVKECTVKTENDYADAIECSLSDTEARTLTDLTGTALKDEPDAISSVTQVRHK